MLFKICESLRTPGEPANAKVSVPVVEIVNEPPESASLSEYTFRA